jgi:YD repeat-containing protein
VGEVAGAEAATTRALSVTGSRRAPAGGGIIYTASYDPVGNPVTMTDPEGTDTLVYDGLNRLTQVSRSNGVVEDYAFNTMGALSVNAGALLNVQRPRLDGNGLADSAVPATYNGLAVTLDGGGRVTSLNGATLASWVVPLRGRGDRQAR